MVAGFRKDFFQIEIMNNIVAACHLLNIAMCDYQESVTTGQTDRHRQTDRQTPDKVIPMCHYASQATQKL